MSKSSSSSIPLITDPPKISAYNRGPILTTFVPPASCLSTLTFSTDMYFGHRDKGYVDAACFPSSTTDYGPWENAWGVYYYSPGICPQGWSQAATLSSSFGKGTTQLKLGDETTAVVCCPSGFSYSSDGHACGSTFWSTTSTLFYINPSLNALNSWVSTDANTPLTTRASGSPYIIFGDGIPIWWQASDLQVFSSAAAAPSITPSMTATSTATLGSGADSATLTQTSPRSPMQTTQPENTSSSDSETSTQTSSSSSLQTPQPANTSSSNNGLSVGSGIAIGVAIALFALGLSAGIAKCFLSKRKQKKARMESSSSMMTGVINLSEHGREMVNRGPVSELYVEEGGRRNWSTGVKRTSELPGQ
ncbi:hypothetical protein sscle_04g039010 [Sclerotinia sclerotiorum 1980 UF-70]|uniref:Uncharacterized protein n=1 Tax=Sclerotinia sclerotiorum (strain ATCC 18683 / 1980 / Ss-1) TaxID=665079 RepID=A0A1D9Q2F6_SCLS1|nr:hypothetical protein sscle_04g039010 [Sclerotinia sclerotiorum 1980 UF-70]